jgi:hypothetical protein
MTPKYRWIHLLVTGSLLCILALAACGSSANEGQPPASTAPSLPEGANLAIADLAKRLDITADQIEAVRVESVEWPDTSLGCPQPGQAYAQVITPGQIVVLSANGQEYEYHTGGDQIVACEP